MNGNKRKTRKLFLLFAVIVITTVVLIVSTYAWFVGISTVNVSDFNVSITASDGLEISLTGASNSWKKGSQVLTISKSAVETGYTNHTNKWSDSLIPLSSDGSINTTYSRLKLYDKASLAATDGGYRILANPVNNTGATEADGYIAFDLFIKNGSGSVYDSSPVEDIFLSKYSYAKTNINSTPNIGVENSLRVGFFALGDVPTAGATQSSITTLNCGSTNSLCTNTLGTTYNIWEPNNGKHATGLVNYYNTICKMRTGTSTYNGLCLPLDVGSNKSTYAINSSITTSDNIVDIYDGGDLNGYTSTTKLTKMNTYKTTDATSVGSSKVSLLKLPGNSITKVRVYIWVEGQDIDNYDIIANQSIDIKFGFTKDRFGVDDTSNTGGGSRASSFEDDSWATIQSNIRSGNPSNTSQYHVGDTREVRIGGNSYTLRLANISTNSNCSNSSYSQTACGFVVEFADVVERRKMNSSDTNVGGWPGSSLYTYLQGSFYNSLPDDLKDVIIDTRVISGYGNNGTDLHNFESNDKIFLFSAIEVFGSDGYDTASSTTHQLDYYRGMTQDGTTSEGEPIYNKVKKLYNNESLWWWLRNPRSNRGDCFRHVNRGGYNGYTEASMSDGVAPAFRIG